jgi:hypothetical protein
MSAFDGKADIIRTCRNVREQAAGAMHRLMQAAKLF